MADPIRTEAAHETTEYDRWLEEQRAKKEALIAELEDLGTEDEIRSDIAGTEQELNAETEAQRIRETSYEQEDKTNGMGIRMIMEMAREVSYTTALKMNNITVKV